MPSPPEISSIPISLLGINLRDLLCHVVERRALFGEGSSGRTAVATPVMSSGTAAAAGEGSPARRRCSHRKGPFLRCSHAGHLGSRVIQDRVVRHEMVP